jgi:hypothetical protein
MLSVLTYQGNANKNIMRYSLTLAQMARIKSQIKGRKIRIAYLASGNVQECSHYGR